MTDKKADLRRQAEEKFANLPENFEKISPDEIQRMLHELQVHQIELEMQNEELRRTQTQLDTSRERYFELYDLAPVGYFSISPKGLILEANLSAATMLGTSRRALVKRTLAQFILKEDQDIYYMHHKRLLESGEPQVCDLRMLKNDEEEFWGHLEATAAQNEEGTLICRVIISDITERKRAENALRESEEQFRHFFENLTLGVAVYEAVDGGDDFIFIDMNMTGQKLSHVSIDEIRGRKITEIFPGVKEMGLLKMLRDVWRTGKPEHLPFFMYHDDRIQEWVENRVFRLPSGDVAAIYDDRTEMVRMEEELRQAQKMESVGRLAGGVAHDFNNMLGVILGHVEMALDRVAPEDSLHSNLTEIRKAAERSAGLTRQLLAFARKQTIEPKVLNLNKNIEGILKMLDRLIGENIELRWSPGAELWQVKVDPAQIDQILANLCVNAKDAIASEISIETENIVFNEDYCAKHSEFSLGEYVRVSVSDNGNGMDKETLEHLFEPFFTTKGIGEGVGLGLATVYGAVKQNNGFINVYSEPEMGTMFSIYLPRYRYSGEDAQASMQASERPPLRGHETVLLVEDEPSILKMTTMMLEMQGYTVIAANSPSEAIRLAQECHEKIHLLITDVVMPGMNGRELDKKLLSIYPGIKSLFMSGYTADVIARHGILDDGVCFIQKPFSIKDLASKIREVLNDN